MCCWKRNRSDEAHRIGEQIKNKLFSLIRGENRRQEISLFLKSLFLAFVLLTIRNSVFFYATSSLFHTFHLVTHAE